MPVTRLRSGAGRRRNYRAMAGMKTRRTYPIVQRTIGGRKVINTRAVAQIAKAAVRKEAEDKFVSVNMSQQFNSSISSASECYPLCPQVPKGTDDFQRIGDKIRGKYLYIKGFAQFHYDPAANLPVIPPATLRVMILSQKNIKVQSEVQSRADVAHLLKDNTATGTARAYTGGIYDNLAPINKDLFKVHMDKKIRFNWQNLQGNSGGVPNVEWQTGNNLTRYFTCRIKAPATMTFDDGNVDSPNNFAPFICVGAVNDDGTSPWTLSTPWLVTAQSVLYYEDS